MVIDVFSKFGWIVPLKDKTGETVASAFKKIFKEKTIPKFLWTDKGKEFYNNQSKSLLDQHNIKLYSIKNEEKSSVVERWNRTIKNKMWKQFTKQSSTQYLDILPEVVDEYQWHTQDFSMGEVSKVTSKICSRSMLWRINNLVQCNKMESKSHSA